MDNNSDHKSILDSKRQSNFEQDSEDILRQISQITPSQDKSFDSPVIFTRNRTIFNDYNIDINQLVRDNNISLFNSHDDKSTKNNKPENILDDSYNTLTNNKQLSLNQKLKYLCSLIQISNINIKKYDDLKQFSNKYLENKDIMLNIFEPTNVLFDVINELIFVIQKELRNNDILMKELKRLRYNRTENEKQIYRLKMIIKNKDKELNELRILKKDDYYKYNENEINELKNENKELYKKINTYKFQIKKFELQSNENRIRLKSSNTAHDTIKNDNNLPPSNLINLKKNNANNIIPNLCNISHINTNNNIIINDLNLNLGNSLKKKKLNNSGLNLINRNYSTSKAINCKNLSQNINLTNNNYINNNIYNDTNDLYNNYSKGRSIIANLMFLLKEINAMLNIYNSSLSKIKINNNYNTINNSNKKEKKNEECEVFEENNNKKIISNDFVKKINDIIINIKNYIKEENKEKLNNNRKPIYVNTSKWKFRKKKKNEIQNHDNNSNDNEEIGSSFNINNKSNIQKRINLKIIDKNNYINNEEISDNKEIPNANDNNVI